MNNGKQAAIVPNAEEEIIVKPFVKQAKIGCEA